MNWRRLFLGTRRDDELDREVQAHLDLEAEERRREGLTQEEAYHAARRAFGNATSIKEETREMWGWASLERLAQDLRYTIRTMRRDAASTALAILIVGLGIGASTIVFSVVSALLVHPLPFKDSARLVWIENSLGPTGSGKAIQVAHLLELRDQTQAFADVAGYLSFKREGDQRLSGPGEPERLTGLAVTENFFSLLGVQPQVGRLFTAEESQWNAPNAVLLSHRLWTRRFASDPGVVGRSVVVNDAATMVVGVLPASFDFADVFEPGGQVDLFRPFPLSPETNRRGNTLLLVGRLKPEAKIENASAEIDALASRANGDPTSNRFEPIISGLRQHISGQHRAAMFLLACAVAMVMLIVCANLSNLLLTRAESRKKEVAIRAALGAGRPRLIRQILTESLVLTCSGAVLGILLASAGVRLLAGSDISLPLRTLLQVDETALLFTSLLAMATGITAGLAPAMRTASLALIEPLKESGRGSSLSKRQKGFRHALIVSEVALACTLLVGAGLLTRSLLHVLDADLGFNPENTIALRVDTGSPYAEHFDDLAFFDEALRRVRSIPGVETAALTDTPPMGHNRQWTAGAKGRVYQRGETPPAYLHVVSECLLSTMGIPLVAGRDFTQYDDQSGPRVVLVNETFANSLWPGESPLGKVLMIGQPYEHEVIGIVRDVRHLAFEKESGPEMYLPIRQTGDYSAMHLVVRGAQSPDGLAVAVRAAVGPLKPTLPLTEVRVLEDVVDKSLSSRRFLVLLLAGFACFALVLVSLGIYAVISYSVNQRKLEIGIRMALGASAATLQRSVLIQTFQLAFVGMTVGLAASWVLGRTIQSLLFDVAPSDPMTFATALVILTAIALLAGYLPARRASRLNPVEALGAE